MKNVLFVVDDKKMGGVSTLLEDILNSLDTKKSNIDLLILNNDGNMFKELNTNINVIYGSKFFVPINYSLSSALKEGNFLKVIKKIKLVFYIKTKLIFFFLKKERKKLLNKKYDIEIAFKDGFCGLFVGAGDSLRKVQWLHADYNKHDDLKNYRKLFQKMYKKFDKIVAISKPVGNYFNEIYGCSEKTIAIYNLVNTDKIRKKSKEFKVNLSNKKTNFISVGRFHPMKGYLRLIDTIFQLKKDNLFNDCHLTLIGDGPEFDSAKNKVNEYNLSKEISLLGSKTNPFPYVKSADVFILGSVYEPFGLTVIESLSVETPVIATSVATIKEMLPKKYGMIVDNSEEGLYAGIKKIISNKKTIENYKKNLVNYEYDTKKIIKQIEKLLEGD